jgi:hypothetical protein
LVGGSMLIPTVLGCYRRHSANNFSCNPFVGGRLPTGNMDNHPKHHIVRLTILDHILTHHEKFYPLLSKGIFIVTLLRLTGPYEIMKSRRKYPDYFRDEWDIPLITFIMSSIIMRMKQLCKSCSEFYKYVFSDDKRSYSDL